MQIGDKLFTKFEKLEWFKLMEKVLRGQKGSQKFSIKTFHNKANILDLTKFPELIIVIDGDKHIMNGKIVYVWVKRVKRVWLLAFDGIKQKRLCPNFSIRKSTTKSRSRILSEDKSRINSPLKWQAAKTVFASLCSHLKVQGGRQDGQAYLGDKLVTSKLFEVPPLSGPLRAIVARTPRQSIEFLW